ncbi:MAG: Gfo/Idh/MocA family oxidoreductase [Tannerellaceae bacterium]
MNQKELSRRLFLKQAAAVSIASAISGFWMPVHGKSLPRNPLISANDRVNIAFIGIGNRGGEIAKELYNTGLCNVVALCDVDMGAPHTQELVNMFPDVPRFQDFRKMFDKMADKIDAVTVGVPDHAHFPITIEAMAHGKHVYVEKPMARTFNEVETMMRAEQKYGVVTQMGNQGHSEANYFQFKAWKEAGIIKDVTAMTAHMNNARRWHTWNPKMTSFPKAEKLPETMDWDTWLGVVKHHDYNHDFVNGQWRCWYDFGMGALGDWGAHIIDTAHEFLDLGLPNEINPTYLKDHNRFFFPMSSTIIFKFPERNGMPAMDITWYDGLDNIPAVPNGYGVSEIDPNIPTVAGGKIQPAKLNPGKEIYSKELTFKGGSHGSTLSIIPDEKAKEMASRLPEVPKSPSNHYANFLLSCMGKEKTRSPFHIAGPLSQVFCLGVLSQRLGEKLLFDRSTKQITNNKLANEMLVGEPPRKGWEEYYKI